MIAVQTGLPDTSSPAPAPETSPSVQDGFTTIYTEPSKVEREEIKSGEFAGFTVENYR